MTDIKTHKNNTSFNAPVCFSHFVYWNSRFVIIAPIAMETRLNPIPTGITQCMSVCSLPFTATSRKHWTTEWMGDSTSFGWLGNMQTFKWFFISRQPFTPVAFKRPVTLPLFLIQFAASCCSAIFVHAVYTMNFVTNGGILHPVIM